VAAQEGRQILVHHEATPLHPAVAVHFIEAMQALIVEALGRVSGRSALDQAREAR
jgi:hypothetical protein